MIQLPACAFNINYYTLSIVYRYYYCDKYIFIKIILNQIKMTSCVPVQNLNGDFALKRDNSTKVRSTSCLSGVASVDFTSRVRNEFREEKQNFLSI